MFQTTNQMFGFPNQSFSEYSPTNSWFRSRHRDTSKGQISGLSSFRTTSSDVACDVRQSWTKKMEPYRIIVSDCLVAHLSSCRSRFWFTWGAPSVGPFVQVKGVGRDSSGYLLADMAYAGEISFFWAMGFVGKAGSSWGGLPISPAKPHCFFAVWIPSVAREVSLGRWESSSALNLHPGLHMFMRPLFTSGEKAYKY